MCQRLQNLIVATAGGWGVGGVVVPEGSVHSGAWAGPAENEMYSHTILSNKHIHRHTGLFSV